MSLQLLYNFTPSPNPITASSDSSNPNVIDLQVMISNPSIEPIQLTAVTITIPTGQEGASTLSDNPNLPAPDYDNNSGWSGSISGDQVIFNLPASGIADSFIFTLPGIQVNETPGAVPIKIVEDGPPTVEDSSTYSLVKQPSNFPITNFYATPATLNNLDQTVTLFWKCSAQGTDYSYSVHSDSWQPDDCLNGGMCYTCTDGANGIQTDPLTQTTAFSLDVIRTNADGSRSIIQTLKTIVEMSLPSISSNSYAETYLSARVVGLHWLAFNAAYCTVELDGAIIVSNAPPDTFSDGYWAVLSEAAGVHQLSVTAHAASGTAQASYIFPEINLNPFITIPNVGGGIEAGPAITPDGTKALIPNSAGVAVVDIASSTVSTTLAMPESGTAKSVAITPEGTLALVTVNDESGQGQVVVFDIATLTVQGSVALYGLGIAIAITPDGALAFVSGLYPENLSVLTIIDIPNMMVEAVIHAGALVMGLAITPDGRLALTANFADNTVTIIDIATRSAIGTVKVGKGIYDIAVTPDSTIALAPNSNDNTVSIIDIASQSVVATVPVGMGPVGIAMLPTSANGVLCLTANTSDSTLTVIDIANRIALPATLNGVSDAWGIAVLPDGSHAVITNTNGDLIQI